MLRKLLLIFLVMWLPLQGYAATTVTCARHHATPAPATGDMHDQHAMTDGHCVSSPETPAAAPQPPCDDCGSCHVVAPALLPAMLSLSDEAGYSFAFAFNMHFPLIFPEQPQRPPYTSLA